MHQKPQQINDCLFLTYIWFCVATSHQINQSAVIQMCKRAEYADTREETDGVLLVADGTVQ